MQVPNESRLIMHALQKIFKTFPVQTVSLMQSRELKEAMRRQQFTLSGSFSLELEAAKNQAWMYSRRTVLA